MAEISKLIKGYKQFYKKHFFPNKSKLYDDLDKFGQKPKTLVIACSDSRVDPSIVSNANPGDIFAIRNVANLVPPYENDHNTHHGVSSALEFAVCFLKVKHIVILGHSKCAGIASLINPEAIENSDFIKKWVEIAEPAKKKLLSQNTEEKDLCHLCEKEAIMLSLENLKTFPWLKDRIDSGDLKLHGWYFSISDGSLREYNEISNEFENIEDGVI